MPNGKSLTDENGGVPELVDVENPEWTDEDFARAVRFSALPAELQELLSQPKHICSELKTKSTNKPEG